jgi:hypothetical protein
LCVFTHSANADIVGARVTVIALFVNSARHITRPQAAFDDIQIANADIIGGQCDVMDDDFIKHTIEEEIGVDLTELLVSHCEGGGSSKVSRIDCGV